jgi:hypothetical protein
VIVQKTNVANFDYTPYMKRFFKKRDPSMFLAPCWNISLKSGDLEKTSSKSTEELTELKEVSPFMA